MGIVEKVFINMDWLATATDAEIVAAIKEATRIPGQAVDGKAASAYFMTSNGSFWQALQKLCPTCKVVAMHMCLENMSTLDLPFHSERY